MKKLYYFRYLSLVLITFISCSETITYPETDSIDIPVLHLNGNNQYFRIPDMAELNLDASRDLTIEMWVNPENSELANLLNKMSLVDNNSTTIRGWSIDILAEETNQNGTNFLSKMNFKYTSYTYNETDGGSVSTSRSSRGIERSDWVHLVLTYREYGLSRKYLNGSTGGGSSGRAIDLDAPGASLNIGGYPDNNEFSLESKFFLIGDIAEVRIWDHVLTNYQITLSANGEIDMDDFINAESGLIGYYKFDVMENLGIGTDGASNDIRDHSYKQNHGEVMGGGTLENRGNFISNN